MNVTETLDLMEEMLDSAWSLPLSGGRSIIDVERLIDLVNDVRMNLPEELRQAKMIVADRKDILQDAKNEADQVIRDAELKAKRLISDEEVVKQARVRANQMMTQAQTQSNEIKQMANNYVEKLLTNAEENLVKNLQDLKEAHTAMRRAGH